MQMQVVLLVALVLSGCARRDADIRPADPNPRPQLLTDVEARVLKLKELARAFAEQAGKLPGQDDAEHRALMAQTFAQLSEILPLLEGPEPSSEFRQHLLVLDHARSQIGNGATTTAADPAIDSGLRAAQRALAGIYQRLFFEQPRVTEAMNQFGAAVADLDNQGGALHPLAVAGAVDNLAKVLENMAAVFGQRLSDTHPAPDPAGKGS